MTPADVWEVMEHFGEPRVIAGTYHVRGMRLWQRRDGTWAPSRRLRDLSFTRPVPISSPEQLHQEMGRLQPSREELIEMGERIRRLLPWHGSILMWVY